MAYDLELAERVRELVAAEVGMTEQRMFGGLGFLINGNMSVAAGSGGGLLVRVDPDEGDALVDDVSVTPMVMRGREMTGWLRVGADAVQSDRQLKEWVARGVGYARSLPAKSSAKASAKTSTTTSAKAPTKSSAKSNTKSAAKPKSKPSPKP